MGLGAYQKPEVKMAELNQPKFQKSTPEIPDNFLESVFSLIPKNTGEGKV